MPKSGLTGSRIRETRLAQGVRQGELARNVGISPSYLNLIEHNRRRIGGKLLVDISNALDVDARFLGEGAQAELLDVLRKSAAEIVGTASEIERTEEMAGRFPGWAGLIAAQHARVETLERTVASLSDRLGHDPQLSASMHEVLSVVTSISSTAAILTDGEPLESEWQARFHRNLHEDSKRLAESAQALVAYLDATDDGQSSADPTVPKEELENWLAATDYHLAALEDPATVSVGKLLADTDKLTSSAATEAFARLYLERYEADAQTVSAVDLATAMAADGFDPLTFAQSVGCDLATVLRRIASLPAQEGAPVGLVICDSSGTLTFCKPVEGFALPRFSAACPLWPLYQALSRPNVPIRATVEQSGHEKLRYLTFAIAQPIDTADYSLAPLNEATMLILPDRDHDREAQKIGTSCRICARNKCRGRREPSILTTGF